MKDEKIDIIIEENIKSVIKKTEFEVSLQTSDEDKQCFYTRGIMASVSFRLMIEALVLTKEPNRREYFEGFIDLMMESMERIKREEEKPTRVYN